MSARRAGIAALLAATAAVAAGCRQMVVVVDRGAYVIRADEARALTATEARALLERLAPESTGDGGNGLFFGYVVLPDGLRHQFRPAGGADVPREFRFADVRAVEVWPHRWVRHELLFLATTIHYFGHAVVAFTRDGAAHAFALFDGLEDARAAGRAVRRLAAGD